MTVVVEVALGILLALLIVIGLWSVMRVKSGDWALPVKDINDKERADKLEKRILEMERKVLEGSFRRERGRDDKQ